MGRVVDQHSRKGCLYLNEAMPTIVPDYSMVNVQVLRALNGKSSQRKYEIPNEPRLFVPS